ncbi:hypothetical protein XU18_1045 [Perkinsela sp. CCAP 1560/4]|nr:hypothetical protein XU18_1045 [Perkinsela sp. CCAP 1560/4]|eukprot:KNH08476.1 hypothetical protein XU18_1045 [Perkinsela sp. CCAP 1560/4]
MNPKYPVVRRGRKSTKSRRLKTLDEDLESNLQKVENKLFTKDKNKAHVKVRIPREVRRGIITPELYEIAREYAPELLATKTSESKRVEADRSTLKRFGFLRLSTIHKFILYQHKKLSAVR